jgi:hypothetical protein
MFDNFDEIVPQIKTNHDGPFGITYDDDRGFSHEEWASIPPIPSALKGTTSFKKYNSIVKEALECLLLNCDFQKLTPLQKEVIAILYSGYKCLGHSCTDIAIKNWLSQPNQKYWERLNWDIIETSFKKHPDEWIKEELEWAESCGVTFKKNWEYSKPKADWMYFGNGYLGAHWNIRNL